MSDKVQTSPPLGCAAVMMGIFRDHLRGAQLPVTQQREAIARVLFESTRHLSAEDVERRLKDRGEHVGKATVYRTLNLLVEVGLATEHDFDEGFKRYEAKVGPARHDHLICTTCGVVEEFHHPGLEDIQDEVTGAEGGAEGFRPVSRQLKIYGICAECRESATAEELRRVG